MTAFEDAVLEVISSLEQGEVVTYGEVADQAGFPGAARAVGTVLRNCEGDIPWWRVIGAGGLIRTPAREKQADRLRSEGILIVGGKVVDVRNH
ncbi:MAG: MGMT family protein [Actinomycetota bacterium]|nr:MGMT family protein [Actinomycetota bacterium]